MLGGCQYFSTVNIPRCLQTIADGCFAAHTEMWLWKKYYILLHPTYAPTKIKLKTKFNTEHYACASFEEIFPFHLHAHTMLLYSNVGSLELAWHKLIRLQQGLVMEIQVDLSEWESKNRPLITVYGLLRKANIACIITSSDHFMSL